MRHTKYLFAAAAIAACSLAAPAQAGIMVQGVNYQLNETIISSTVAAFNLSITNINAASPKNDRYGVEAVAFTNPANFLSVIAPGFTYQAGGLGGMGCNGTGNFFCLQNNTAQTGPILAPGSSINVDFTVTLSGGDWNTYAWAPVFKIDWVGGQINYDLVAQTLKPDIVRATVPEPSSLAVIAMGLLGAGYLLRRNRKTSAAR